MNFQIHALPIELFSPLFALNEDALRTRSIRRVVADASGGFPCRVSLQDAVEGEHLLLLPCEHHSGNTPYRASGPIYVRKDAIQARPAADEVPELLRRRLLSLRAYSENGMMVSADVVPGTEVETGIVQLFELGRTAYLHIHYAKPGCYACRVTRA